MSEWISVKDRLPETCDEVLGYPSFYGKPSAVRFYKIADVWTQSFVNGSVNELITHWMPLPAPPEAL